MGLTPMVKLSRMLPANCADIFVKLEYFNPTGSYKDRLALAIVEAAERRGDIGPDVTLAEYTGGSTGSSLAFICATKGYHFKAISSDAFAREKLQTIKLFGADLEILPSVGGQITPDLFVRMEERVLQLQKEGCYWTRQFVNPDIAPGYHPMGREILEQVGRRIDVFCAAVGTGGMLTGVSDVLKGSDPSTRVVALEPASSAFLSTGKSGAHHIEGIAIGRRPPMLQEDGYDSAMAFEEGRARETARELARKEGIFAGTSSGLNVCAAIEIGKQLGPGKTVVTVACDSGMKYLAGDLFVDF
ncbi:MAG: cysteine synthase family protein [Bacteroidota bacterium]|nr:cysteine synthase family protein [Bacteroidota bacterium]MDP4246318.1 cysteine synthase family protein [Bacteroidota bacterium]MDP4259805.1 cysteine synthase family protein [Bacteroidota bacterium]